MQETIGKRIMQNRKQLKLTQDQLAEQLGVTAQAVSKWENDQSCPDITMLPKLAAIFGITTDELLGGQQAEKVHMGEVVEPIAETEANHDNKGFHFEYNGGRLGALIFALFILGVGVQMLIAALLHIDIGFWSILWPTALMLFVGVYGLSKKFSFLGIGGLLFGAYFIANNWKLLPFTLGGEIVIPVVIVLFGLGLLADAFKKPKKPKINVSCGETGKTKINYRPYADSFDYSASFGEERRLVTLSELNTGHIETCFGDYTVDLSGVEQVGSHCVLEANCSFGELRILVPNRFCVKMDSSTAFAEASLHGNPGSDACGTILLEAHANFGEIRVEYI